MLDASSGPTQHNTLQHILSSHLFIIWQKWFTSWPYNLAQLDQTYISVSVNPWMCQILRVAHTGARSTVIHHDLGDCIWMQENREQNVYDQTCTEVKWWRRSKMYRVELSVWQFWTVQNLRAGSCHFSECVQAAEMLVEVIWVESSIVMCKQGVLQVVLGRVWNM